MERLVFAYLPPGNAGDYLSHNILIEPFKLKKRDTVVLTAPRFLFVKLFYTVFEIANIRTAIGLKREITNRCNQHINPKRYYTEKEICTGS